MDRVGFAAVPSWLVQSPDVSVDCIGVYASLASRAGYEAIFPSVETIAAELSINRNRVMAAVKFLEGLGVVERRSRPGDGGGRKSSVYVLKSGSFPQGKVTYPDFAPSEAKSHILTLPPATPSYVYIDKDSTSLFHEKGDVVTPAVDNSKADKKQPGGCKKRSKHDYESTSGFIEFWSAYPARRNDNKANALKAFKNAVERGADPEQLIRAAAAYAADPERQRDGGRYTKHASTFLNQDAWEGYVARSEPVSETVSDPAAEIPEGYRDHFGW